jgi:hypothetical protein
LTVSSVWRSFNFRGGYLQCSGGRSHIET